MLACVLTPHFAAEHASAGEPPPGAPAWLAGHVFDGQDGCLAVRKDQKLRSGDEVLVFASGEKPVGRKIEYVIAGDSLRTVFRARHYDGVYADKDLWSRIGCYWGLGMLDDPPAESIARYEPEREESPDVLAITGLPRSVRVVGGDGNRLGPQELEHLRRSCAHFLPSGFSKSNLLLAGYRFVSIPHDTLFELFVGKPFGGAQSPNAVMDSVQVCRLFLANEKVLCLQPFSRVSGQEERVETEAPQLTQANWFENLDDTIGFVSFDDGATWSRLSVNGGFEGLDWAITKLTSGMPRLWSFYLYTRH
jgi:hypothetical protein